MSTNPTLGEVNLRRPRLNDGQAIHQLIQGSPPLDCNSPYSYFLLSSHFADTCVVAEQGAELGGFLSAYFRPDAPDTLFVWQVVVHQSMRKQGVASLMLNSLLSRPECGHTRWLEATVGPSNIASRTLFSSYAQTEGVEFAEKEFLAAEAFGGQQHEPEILLRIGPLDVASS